LLSLALSWAFDDFITALPLFIALPLAAAAGRFSPEPDAEGLFMQAAAFPSTFARSPFITFSNALGSCKNWNAQMSTTVRAPT